MSVKREAVRSRARLLRVIRSFFHHEDVVEVSTPVRIATPAIEEHIDAIPAGGRYLRTSPECHMKRMVQAGFERIYQIGPCFREDEHGCRHRSEFMMLEWYTAGANYRDVLLQLQRLVACVFREFFGGTNCVYQGGRIDVSAPWPEWCVADAFTQLAGMSVGEALDQGVFDDMLVDRIEPALDPTRPVVMIDYPIQLAAMARASDTTPSVAERWELYCGGLELANAYSELTDPIEQRSRLAACAASRTASVRPVYALDQAFLAALERGLPDCGGCALGVDRLLMLLCDTADIADVIFFD